jgi:hypothetical protein
MMYTRGCPDRAGGSAPLEKTTAAGQLEVKRAFAFLREAKENLTQSRKADFAPSPPLATSARDAKGRRTDLTVRKDHKGHKDRGTNLCTFVVGRRFWGVIE